MADLHARQSNELQLENENVKLKNTVCMETIETLQVGEIGEKEQRIVTLNAQLLQAQSMRLESELRVEHLQVRI